MFNQGFKEIKSSNEHNWFVELKVVDCLTSKVKQNYKEKDIYFKGVGGCLVQTLQKILIKPTSFVDERQSQFEYIYFKSKSFRHNYNFVQGASKNCSTFD